MTVYLMAGTLLLLVLIQAWIPYFVRTTEVFGIYVPEPYSQDTMLLKMRKRYAIVIGIAGSAAVLGYLAVFSRSDAPEEAAALWGIGLQFGLLLFSMALYLSNHFRVKEEKRLRQWTAGKKEKVVVDLDFRKDLEMVSGIAFLLPMVITGGLIFYTWFNYASLPLQIPVHWGPGGEPDRFAEKSIFTGVSLPLVLLVMQLLFYSFNRSIGGSGAKIRASSRKRSRERELVSRKYGSLLLFIVSISSTLLLACLQLSIIHQEMGSALLVMGASVSFLILVLGAVAVYAVKVVKSGADIEEAPADPGIIDADDDRVWKAGIFYFNREDPSLMVEKRFGIGWTVNFGNPRSWLLLLLPLAILLGIAFAI
ncbi:DUF1648 domain-containing protein [Planococcus sp. FY231025]|uniref:DUF1648 domain-containing protein n=1 Tax=Planococcus sp. FY231025 TaxID=3455699 RepID=UPI003F906931